VASKQAKDENPRKTDQERSIEGKGIERKRSIEVDVVFAPKLRQVYIYYL
jgi:hypothetical protein